MNGNVSYPERPDKGELKSTLDAICEAKKELYNEVEKRSAVNELKRIIGIGRKHCIALVNEDKECPANIWEQVKKEYDKVC